MTPRRRPSFIFAAAIALFGALIVALVVVVPAAQTATTANSDGSLSMAPGSSISLSCPGDLTNSGNSGSETVTCAGATTTTTTVPPTTTTTTPQTTTTTSTIPPTTTTTTTTTLPPPTSGLQLGSYNGAANPAGDDSFASETGTTDPLYSDYLDGSSWSSMVGSPGDPPWVIGQLKGQLGSKRLVLSVPLVNAGYSSDQQALAAYVADPSGWDEDFAILAQNLVADGFGNAIIRLMWEPDNGIYSNDDLTSAANYATLWRDAYTSMMSVSGAQFAWAWYWGGNFDTTTNNTAWPGSQYVTYVTFDEYDQSWDTSCGIAYNGTSWTRTQSQCVWDDDLLQVLTGLADFATVMDKPIGIGEWGVIDRSDGHGGGDDATFVFNFVDWMKANNVAWASYFNFDNGADSVLTDFPNSLAAFQAELG